MTTINKTTNRMRNTVPTPIDAISNIASLESSGFVSWLTSVSGESEVVLESVLSEDGWEEVTPTSDGSEVVVISDGGRVIVSGMSVGSEKVDVGVSGSVLSEGDSENVGSLVGATVGCVVTVMKCDDERVGVEVGMDCEEDGRAGSRER